MTERLWNRVGGRRTISVAVTAAILVGASALGSADVTLANVATPPTPPAPTTTTTSVPPTTTVAPTTSMAPTTTVPVTTAPAATTTTAPAATTTSTTSTTTTTTVPITAAAAPGCSASRILLPGYAGLDVACLDNTLFVMGLLDAPNNVVDTATQQALRDAQAALGIYPSGYGGPATLSALGLWQRPAVAPSLPAGSFGCTGSRLLFDGYVGLDVACLDNILLLLGYPIAPNNVVDAGTTSAVRALQSDLGLSEGGTPGPVTLTAIGMWVPPPDDVAPPAGSYGCAVARILLPGYVGLDVQCMDNVLSMMGLLATPNNVVDAATQHALRRAHELFGIYPSGVGGPATLSRLSLWQTPGSSPWSPPRGAFGCLTYRPLPAGTQGLDAACLDNILLILGYRITPNNVIDAGTASALRAFQAHMGLPVDGVAGATT